MDNQINVDNLFNQQVNYFSSGKTRDINTRIENLKLLRSAILRYEDEISNALRADLHKWKFEAYANYEAGDFRPDSPCYYLR